MASKTTNIGKKVEFVKKPLRQNPENFIDNWVSGEVKKQASSIELKRTTIYLPEDLRQKLKYMALEEGLTMTEIIIDSIKKRIS